MGLGMLQPIHLVVIVLVMLLLFGIFVGTAMFLIRYAQRQRYSAEKRQQSQE